MTVLTKDEAELVARMERGLKHLDDTREEWDKLPERDRAVGRGEVGTHVLNELPALVAIIRRTTFVREDGV